MADNARMLLVRGMAAAKAKEIDEARFYLEWVLRTDADRQQKAQAWLWLSGITDDPATKRDCLEEALVLDPANVTARRGMAILDGRLDPNEIIDPDRKPTTTREEPPKPVETQRFICQKCGGKMAFMPDGKSLQCEYCGQQQTLFAAINAGAMVQEHDFVVAMATVKGHARPEGMRSFNCQGCGASFMLAPDVLSLNCSYCGSAHVVELPETRELIPPEGLIPLGVPQQEAKRAFQRWLKKKNLKNVEASPVRGLYVPAWTFDLVGEIRWQCFTYRDESASFEVGGFSMSLSGSSDNRKLAREEGSYPIYEDDILVPATHKLSSDLIIKEVDHFVLGDVVPYDQAYLADWPAEVYEITVSDASLVARRKVLEKARKFAQTRLNATLGYVKDLQFNTAGIVVESFKLILLPVWVARYRHQGKTYRVLINGQTGRVRAEAPRNWLQNFLGSIFD